MGVRDDANEIVSRHEQELVERASALEQDIKGRVRQIRKLWVELAEDLYEFDRMAGWKVLKYGSFAEWLASPDVEIGRSRAYLLVEAHRELVVTRGVDRAQLARVEISKVQVALPAVRRGQVKADRAVADAEVLTVRDLKESYENLPVGQQAHSKPIEPDRFVWDTCEHCGSRYKRRAA